MTGLHKNLINGEWVQADSGATIDVINPATGLKFGTVPKSGKAETRRAIEAADAAFQGWRHTSVLTPVVDGVIAGF